MVTAGGLSAAGAESPPTVRAACGDCGTLAAPVGFAVGATFGSGTARDPAAGNGPSPSVIDAVIVKLFGPSAKVCVTVTDPPPNSVATWAAVSGVLVPSPHAMLAAVGVSGPGSVYPS